MGKFFSAVRESIGLFSDNPKLVLPKLIVAFLYSFVFVLSAGFFLDVFQDPEGTSLLTGIFLLAVESLFMLVDLFVNIMFPFMVKQHRSGSGISLRGAFNEALKGFLPAAIPVISIFVALAVAAVCWTSVFMVLLYDGSPLLGGMNALLLFGPVALMIVAAVFAFYLVIPVSTIERKGFFGSLSRSLSISLSNWKDVSKATVFSFAVSGVSMLLALAINLVSPEDGLVFWAAFIIVRFLTAYIFTYIYVLNPVFYFSYAAALYPVNETVAANANGAANATGAASTSHGKKPKKAS
ncbi:Uncharacterised protein [uncultured archaeon]|nr:Uncharacterised protein [uncultured archaeon]